MKPDKHATPRRRRRRKAGDTAALRRVMWETILRTEEILIDPDATPEVVLRAANAIATLGGAYSNVTKAHEFEARLAELERRAEEQKGLAP